MASGSCLSLVSPPTIASNPGISKLFLRPPRTAVSSNKTARSLQTISCSSTRHNVDLGIHLEFAHHDPNFARLNNGGFGSCPASVTAAQHRWQLEFLRQPDKFYSTPQRPLMLHSRTMIKELINADSVDQISLVDNATTAAAIVFQRTAWAFSEGYFQPGDAVLMLHHSYGAIKNSLHAYVTRAGGAVFEVPLSFPAASKEQIISEFRSVFVRARAQGKRVRLASIDHVTAMPSLAMPLKELVEVCREVGVEQVFVDGAHGLGCVSGVDMQEIGADFYTSSLHKWFFCPPSVAFLYCRNPADSTLPELHHPVVSLEYGQGLPIECSWIGMRDYSQQLVIPSAIEFVNRFEGGVEGITRKNHEAVVEMGQMLADAWGTHLGGPPEMFASMIMVGLPAALGINSSAAASALRVNLRDNFGVEVQTYYRPPQDGDGDVDPNPLTGYARVSHQVYNTVRDYYKLRDAISQLVRDGYTPSLSNEEYLRQLPLL